MFYISTIKTLSKALVLLSIFSIFFVSSINTYAQWPNADDNINCTGANPTEPCKSLSRYPGPDEILGTADDVWDNGDKSLNFDSPFTYGGTLPDQSNIQATPGLANEGLDFCAANMRYRSGSIVDDSSNGANCGEVVRGIAGDPDAVGVGGYLAYGPYVQNLTDDQWYEVTFRIKVENDTTPATSDVFRLDGNFKPDFATAGTSIGSEYYSSSDLTIGSYADYTFKFFKTASLDIGEFRVYSFNTADIYVDQISLAETVAPQDSENVKVYEGEKMFFWNNGLMSNQNISEAGSSNEATRKSTGRGYINFGPRNSDQEGGKWYTANFTLKVDPVGDTSGKYLVLEAHNGFGGLGNLGRLRVPLAEVPTSEYADFSLDFYKPDNSGLMEYRVQNTDSFTTYLDKITVSEITSGSFEKNYEAEDYGYRGSIIDDSGVMVVNQTSSAWMVFGQYATLPDTNSNLGTYTANYCVKTTGSGTGFIGRALIYQGSNILSVTNFYSEDLNNQGGCESGYFEVTSNPFTITDMSIKVDFRYGQFTDGTNVDKVIVRGN